MTSGKHLSECRYTLTCGMVFTQTTFRKLTKWSAAVHEGIPAFIRRGWKCKKYKSSNPLGFEANYGFHCTGVHETHNRLHVNTLNGISLTSFKKVDIAGRNAYKHSGFLYYYVLLYVTCLSCMQRKCVAGWYVMALILSRHVNPSITYKYSVRTSQRTRCQQTSLGM